MTERSGVFSAGATGVPVTTTSIVLEESYKTMNQNASSSSPAQNDVVQNHTTTNNNTSASLMAPSDEERPPPERLSSNNSNDVWSVGSRDWQRSLSGELGYYSSQDSGMAAEDDMIWDWDFLNTEQEFSDMVDQLDIPWELLPDNVTTSNPNPPQPPQNVIEKNHQGKVAKEMTNSVLITDHSSCNNSSILSLESSGVEASFGSLVNTCEGNHEVKSYHVPEIGMKFSCEEEALKFYKKYAMEMGFKVRKGKVQRSANKSITKRYFYCSNEGFRSKKQLTNMKKFTKKETRTGCKAMIQITFKNKECFISRFISNHNHELQGSTQRYYIDSCSTIREVDSLLQPIREIEAANTSSVAPVGWIEKLKNLFLYQGETSKGTMESQIKKKRKNEEREDKPAIIQHEPSIEVLNDVRNTSSVAPVGWIEKLKALFLYKGETSKGTTESQIQRKRKIEEREDEPAIIQHEPSIEVLNDVRNTSSVAPVGWIEKLRALFLYQGETSKGTMESQIQKKRKIEEREKMNLPSSSISLP